MQCAHRGTGTRSAMAFPSQHGTDRVAALYAGKKIKYKRQRLCRPENCEGQGGAERRRTDRMPLGGGSSGLNTQLVFKCSETRVPPVIRRVLTSKVFSTPAPQPACVRLSSVGRVREREA